MLNSIIVINLYTHLIAGKKEGRKEGGTEESRAAASIPSVGSLLPSLHHPRIMIPQLPLPPSPSPLPQCRPRRAACALLAEETACCYRRCPHPHCRRPRRPRRRHARGRKDTVFGSPSSSTQLQSKATRMIHPHSAKTRALSSSSHGN